MHVDRRRTFVSQSLQSLAQELTQHDSSAYGPDDGLPELVDTITNKLASKNRLPSEETAVMVTAGANQVRSIGIRFPIDRPTDRPTDRPIDLLLSLCLPRVLSPRRS